MASVLVQFKGQTKELQLAHGERTTWAQLQELLEHEFQVPRDAQRVFFNKKRVEFDEEEVTKTLLRDSGWEFEALTPPRVVLMAGASRNQIEAMKKTQEEVEAEQRIRANRRVVDIEKRNQQHEAREAVSTDYRFHAIEVLENFSDSDRARNILEQLANDRGVLAVMAKHKWSVGCLAEMYPDGKVGVDPVCVLGLNTNKGQKIQLRLRTDDLRGFRKFLSIKKVLYHELSHNVHSEHDSKFYQLMRQVERECDELDWSNSGGRTVGGSSNVAVIPDMDDDTIASSGQRLGGGDNTVSRLLRYDTVQPIDERRVPSEESIAPLDALVNGSLPSHAAVVPPVPTSKDDQQAQPEPMDVDTSESVQAPETNLGESSDRLPPLPLVDESFGDYQPSERELRMRQALEALRTHYPADIARSAATLLLKIICNIVQHPEEPKFKSIRKSNRLFETRIACFTESLDFLFAIGFEDQGEAVTLVRNDAAVLWIGRSMLEPLLN